MGNKNTTPPAFKFWLDNHRNKPWEMSVEDFRQRFYVWLVKQTEESLRYPGHNEEAALELMVKKFINESKYTMGLSSVAEPGQLSDMLDAVRAIRAEYMKGGKQ